MEMDLEPGQQGRGRLCQPVEVVPPAMTGELVLQVAPQALNQVELGRIGGQEEGLKPIGEALPVGAQRMALVVAGIIEHHHCRLTLRQRLGEVVEESCKGRLILAPARLPDQLPTRIIHRPEHGELVILASRWDLQWAPFAPPDLCQVGVGVDLRVVHIDQMESSGLSNRFFWSQSRTCLAAATASRSWRCVRS